MNDAAPVTADTEGVRIRGDGYTAEAGWFGPEDRPRFGWLYHPDTSAENDVGIVIVPPFGREEICTHRTLRHLAEDAAKTGFVAVRFDLDGTGDSIGDDTDPDRIDAWIASIHDACDLARTTGAAQIMLVGVRLGATLAALAAAYREDAAALVAFNAVISGKAYLRELRAFQLAMNLQPAPVSAAEAGQETSGFLLTEATCATLKAIDLAGTDAPPAPVVHVLERDDLPKRKTWPEHLRALGATVVEQRITGYVSMLDDPHRAHVAQDFIDACISCSRGLPAVRNMPTSFAAAILRTFAASRTGDTPIVEAPVAPGAGMFAILTRPATGNARRALLLLNAGAIRHIGSNRTDVTLARRLAARGLQVLRADLTGIGDSQTRANADENTVYGSHSSEDVGLLVAWLRARNMTTITAGGMCSGAYHALRAAIAGQPINGVYLINCGVFGPTVDFDPEGSSLFGDITHYNQAVKSSRSWRKLLTGKVAFGKIVRVAVWHAKTRLAALWRETARWLRIPLRDDLGNDLRTLSQRGVRMHCLFSANEPGLTLLTSEAGSVLPRLRKSGALSLQVFEGPDHTFTQRWGQVLLSNAIEEMLAPTKARDQ